MTDVTDYVELRRAHEFEDWVGANTGWLCIRFDLWPHDGVEPVIVFAHSTDPWRREFCIKYVARYSDVLDFSPLSDFDAAAPIAEETAGVFPLDEGAAELLRLWHRAQRSNDYTFDVERALMSIPMGDE